MSAIIINNTQSLILTSCLITNLLTMRYADVTNKQPQPYIRISVLKPIRLGTEISRIEAITVSMNLLLFDIGSNFKNFNATTAKIIKGITESNLATSKL